MTLRHDCIVFGLLTARGILLLTLRQKRFCQEKNKETNCNSKTPERCAGEGREKRTDPAKRIFFQKLQEAAPLKKFQEAAPLSPLKTLIWK